MSNSFTFDPVAVVVDWLDACRLGKLDALLDLYDEQATQDCHCENVTLAGRKAIASYWAPKLQDRRGPMAFTLDELALMGNSVQVDYRGYQGNPIRIFVHCTEAGKILHTSCRPQASWEN